MDKTVKIVRLVTGEMLLARVKDEDVTTPSGQAVKLYNPLLLGMGPDPSDPTGRKLMVNMMDYMPFASDKEFVFPWSQVLHMTTPNEGLANAWTQKNSNLVVPTVQGPQLIKG